MAVRALIRNIRLLRRVLVVRGGCTVYIDSDDGCIWNPFFSELIQARSRRLTRIFSSDCAFFDRQTRTARELGKAEGDLELGDRLAIQALTEQQRPAGRSQAAALRDVLRARAAASPSR